MVPLKCESISELLSPYIDGRVDEGERRAVDEHVAQCARCARELGEFRFTVDALRRVPELPVPRSFAIPAQGDWSRQRRPAALGSTLFPYLRNASVGLAAALVLMFVAGLYLQPNSLPYSLARKSQPPTPASSGGAPTDSRQQGNPFSQTLMEQAKRGVESAPGPAPTPQPPLAARSVAPPAAPAPELSSDQPVDNFSSGASPPSGDRTQTDASGGQAPAFAVKPAESTGSNASGEAEKTVEPSAVAFGEVDGDRGPAVWPLFEIQLGLLGLLLVFVTATIVLWRRGA